MEDDGGDGDGDGDDDDVSCGSDSDMEDGDFLGTDKDDSGKGTSMLTSIIPKKVSL